MPLYLRLFHGRADPSDVLNDWGTDGPTIGPFDTYHSTYCEALELWNGEASFELSADRGLVRFGGVFYGDFELTETAFSTPALSLEDAARTSLTTTRAPALNDRVAPLVHVFLDAIRSQHGDELARRLSLAIKAALQ